MIPIKLQLVLFVILVFMIVSSPMTYGITNKFIGMPLGFSLYSGEPTRLGIFIHAIVAGLLTWLYLQTFKV